MIEPIRLATPEEVESIKETSDLGPGCAVYAMGDKIKGVLRQCYELDPVYSEGASNNQKHFFVTNIETFLRLSGVPKYYFNVHANEESAHWRKVLESFGAVAVSTEPEIRYKKALV